MKLGKIFMGFAALAAMTMVSCKEEIEQGGNLPSLSVDPTELTFEATGGDQTVMVTSNVSWTAEVTEGTEDVTVSQEAGDASDMAIPVDITLKANLGETDRTFKVTFKAAGVEPVVVNITQGSTADKEYAKIADVRALGKDQTIAANTVIKAAVTHDGRLNNMVSKKNIFVQDATGAILLRLKADPAEPYVLGQELEIDLSGLKVAERSGSLQVELDAAVAIKKLGVKELTPRVITAKQLVSNEFEGQYVTVENVQVQTAELEKTYATAAEHGKVTMEANDGESTFILFSAKYFIHKDTTVPQGSGNITGVAMRYNDDSQIAFAKYAEKAEDLCKLDGQRFGAAPSLKIDGHYKTMLPKAGGKVVVDLITNVDWTATAPEGMTVTPASGAASDQPIKLELTIAETAADRELELVVEGSGKSANFVVDQRFDVPVKTAAEFEGLPDAQKDGPKVYYMITGQIESLDANKETSFTIKDETGSLYVYSLNIKNGADMAEVRKVGNKVTLMGEKSTYNGPQIKFPVLISWEKGEAPVEPATVLEFKNYYKATVGQKGDVHMAIESNKPWSVELPEGVTANPASGEATEYTKVVLTVAETAAEGELKVVFKAGDKTKEMSLFRQQTIATKTVKEILALQVDKTVMYQVSGVVANASGSTFDLVNGEDKIQVYMMNIWNGTDKTNQVISNGNNVTLVGYRGAYEGKDQIVNSALVSWKEAETTVPALPTDGTFTKVTAAPTDWAGHYLIVWNGNAHATLDGKDLKKTATVTDVDGKIANSAEISKAIMTVAAIDGGFSMKYPDGKFFSMVHNGSASSGTAFKLGLEYTANGVKISGVPSGKTDTYYLYNQSSQYMRCYVDKSSDSKYVLPTLYKLDK